MIPETMHHSDTNVNQDPLGTAAQPVTNPPGLTIIGSTQSHLGYKYIKERLGQKRHWSQLVYLLWNLFFPQVSHQAVEENSRAGIQISAQCVCGAGGRGERDGGRGEREERESNV